ncbi:NADH dehydrogenase [ubiquinone] 1 alpha subcomplex assembly factor 3 [Euwallacea fornicatus]|uniref:NADH dehydrogenase [ubiquinone] 1 alpha subcomplex assembly factor 3 n=1 Tax=Euwallacea fornicatus TaxID=995702 RepID=UPI0033901520
MNFPVNRIFGSSTKCLKNIILRYLSKSTASNALNPPNTYADEGRTTVHVMNKDYEYGLMIDGYSEVGFKLNNQITILGPMIICPRSVLAWNISDIEDIHEESLSLFKVLEPKVDIIVLGTGDKVENRDIFSTLVNFSRKYKLSFEILPTESACPTFNFLNAEGRNVVGALIPPKTISITEDDLVRSKIRYQNVLDHREK